MAQFLYTYLLISDRTTLSDVINANALAQP